MRKFLKYILIVCVMFSFFCTSVIASENDSYVESNAGGTKLEETVRSQVSAFAKSINQSKADDSAAAALAKHGLTGRGKTLNVGKTHALTATLMNSILVQEALTDSISRSIVFMQDVGLKHVCNIGPVQWYDDLNKYFYNINLMNSDNIGHTNRDYLLCKKKLTKKNAYDESLDWMAGFTRATIYVDLHKTTANEATYRIKFNIWDIFDFSTSTSDGFKNFISGIGAALFTEFEWNSTVTFDIKVPYTPCDHKADVFKLTYDSDNNMIVSANDTGISYNIINQHTYFTSTGKTRYYYELDDMIQLYANKPWILEYDIKKFNSLLLCATLANFNKNYPSLYHYRGNSVYFKNNEYVEVSDSIVKEYGLESKNNYITYRHEASLTDIPISYNTLYTYRYENIIDKKGNNMIYLTIIETDSGNVIANKIPIDDSYATENWSKKESLISEESDYCNGKNIFFKYIGRQYNAFSASEFELRVWENGKEDSSGSAYVATKVVKPTCSSQGYTEYTCNKCGHVTKKDYTSKLEHKYSSKVTQPTCTEQGYTTYTCSSCKDSYKGDYVSKLGHSFSEYVSNHDATLYEDGTKSAKCDRCSEVSTIVDEGTKLYVTALEISKKPSKLEYYEGEELDLCDMEVIAYLNNHTSVPFTDYEVSGYDSSVIGSQVVTVSYKGCSDTFIVVVNELVKNISSSVFTVSDGYISKISENTTVEMLLDGLADKEFIKVYKNDVEMSSDSLVSTGMVVRLLNHDKIMDEVIVVVSGDVNCDGKITITDMLGVKGHVLEKNTYEGYLMMAADTSGDGKVTITDFIQIKAHVLGKSLIVAK